MEPSERSQTGAAPAQPGRTAWREAAAAEYDRWYESPVNVFIDEVEREAIREILPAPTPGAMLLDIGTGTGHWLPLLTGAGDTVAGLDLSASMLNIAKSKLGRKFSLIQGDAFCLPFADSCFDVVCAITVLEFVGDHIAVLDEMHRCVKPGGTLVVGVLNALSFLGIRRKILRGRTFRNAHFFTIWELRRCLAKYGSTVLATCSFLPPYAWLLPLGGWVERIGRTIAAPWGQLIVARVEVPRNG